MALIRFGAGVVQMSGSIAGTTHARNRFGNYTRARTKPVNPNSTLQALQRATLSYLVERWNNTLTAAQRIAWNSYAAAIAMKNRLGETVYLTGFNHYVRSNSILKRLALTVVDDGPEEIALPEKDPTFTISISAATQNIAMTIDNTLEWGNETGGYLFVFEGVPQLHTRNFFGGPWRYSGKVDGKDGQPPTGNPIISSVFTGIEGQKVWAYARIIRKDGRLSEPFYASCIVIA